MPFVSQIKPLLKTPELVEPAPAGPAPIAIPPIPAYTLQQTIFTFCSGAVVPIVGATVLSLVPGFEVLIDNIINDLAKTIISASCITTGLSASLSLALMNRKKYDYTLSNQKFFFHKISLLAVCLFINNKVGFIPTSLVISIATGLGIGLGLSRYTKRIKAPIALVAATAIFAACILRDIPWLKNQVAQHLITYDRQFDSWGNMRSIAIFPK